MTLTSSSYVRLPVCLFVTQVFDESALSQRCKEEMYKCYPDAKRAHLKNGGNFPYLSRSDEVNTHLEVREERERERERERAHHFHACTNTSPSLPFPPSLPPKIHLLPFQGARFCAKDPSQVDPEEVRAAKGEIDPPSST